MLIAAFASVPFLLAVGCLLNRRHSRLWMALTVVVISTLSWALVIWWLGQGDGSPLRIELGDWPEPLAIRLVLDSFSVGMIALTATLGTLLSLYALFDRKIAANDWLWPLWILLWASMNALYLSGDLFNIYVTLELVGLAAVGLVVRSGTRQALDAAMRYLLVSLVGSLFYLLAVALLYGQYGVLDIALLSEEIRPDLLSWVALGLLSAGLMAKSALFPLHTWLPLAHGSAHPMVSAVLSGLVIKTGIYLLFVFWGGLFAPVINTNGALFLGWLGAAAVLWGGLQALLTPRLKLVVAWSTVAQVGYLFMLLYLLLVLAEPEIALMGAFYFIVSHALAKSAMFIAAGNIQNAGGTDQLDQLAASLATHPKSMVAFAVAGVSLAGLPPTGGFIAKWLMLQGAITAQAWLFLAVMLVGGLLTAGYTMRVLVCGFNQKAIEQSPPPAKPIARSLENLGLGLALLVVVSGFAAGWIFAHLPLIGVL